MDIIKKVLYTLTGNQVIYPKTSADQIEGLATVAKTGSYSDLTNKPSTPSVPTKVSQLTNDAGYVTSAEINELKDQVALLSATVIDTKPTQSGTLTYSGGSQSPTWNNYNSNQLTMSGTTSGTNVGTYTATFTPKATYRWGTNITTMSNSRNGQNSNWSIVKRTPSISYQDHNNTSKTNLSNYWILSEDTDKSAKLNIVTNSDSTLSVTGNTNSNIKVSLANKLLTVSGFTTDKQSTTVTVTSANNANNNASSKNITVSYAIKPESSTSVVVYANTMNYDNTPKAVSDLLTAINNNNVASKFNVGDFVDLGPQDVKFCESVNDHLYGLILGINHNKAIENSTATTTVSIMLLTAPAVARANTSGNKYCFTNASISYSYNSNDRYNANFNYIANNNNNNNNKDNYVYGFHNTGASPAFNGSNSTDESINWNTYKEYLKEDGVIYKGLPASIKSYIIPTLKYTEPSYGTNAITSETSKLFLLSEYEVFGEQVFSISTKEVGTKIIMYDYFKTNPRKLTNVYSVSSYSNWWLRSPSWYSSSACCVTSWDGSVDNVARSNSFALFPVFNLGK